MGRQLPAAQIFERTDGSVEARVVARGLRGVLGDVGGHPAGPLVAVLEDLYVDLPTPGGTRLRVADGDGAGRLQAGSGELSGVDRRYRALGAVGPHDGVQVHDTTALELGHPAE